MGGISPDKPASICSECFAWGVLPGYCCRACYTFRNVHPSGRCTACRRTVPIKEGYCRLCRTSDSSPKSTAALPECGLHLRSHLPNRFRYPPDAERRHAGHNSTQYTRTISLVYFKSCKSCRNDTRRDVSHHGKWARTNFQPSSTRGAEDPGGASSAAIQQALDVGVIDEQWFRRADEGALSRRQAPR